MLEQQQSDNLNLMIPVQFSNITNQKVRFEAAKRNENSTDEFDELESQRRTPVNELQQTNTFTIEIPSVPRLKRKYYSSSYSSD
ncbi:hypothetical protein M3Y96_01247400 [Aphelenchoides besseyi]|nr:hypothetical protein M3Y96_01247400 [Aphelenchoides besseyi]